MRNEVQVVLTVLSIDGENDPDIISIIAASAALAISDIPWDGPVGAVRVGMVDGKIIINPTTAQEENSVLHLTLSGTDKQINMIEASAQEVPEEDLLHAFEKGHEAVGEITKFIREIVAEVGVPKRAATLLRGSDDLENRIKEVLLSHGIEDALYGTKTEIAAQTTHVYDTAKSAVEETLEEDEKEYFSDIFSLVYDDICDTIVHRNIIENNRRPDGRTPDEIRPITCDVGILPRPHGSALFTRGETQALTVTTLGAPGDQQIIDTMEVDKKKAYIHHYNFPPYSVGEVRFMRGPGRREIGHGALAEKALLPVLPQKDAFPYTMLLVSEILESNGSSSMAATCGSTLSLMHAGVPITRPVSGIAMGMMSDTSGTYTVLSDIQGAEDHYGDMDLKVAGTEKGITAVQMDVKMSGITAEMFRATLEQARSGRMHILDKMLATIPQPNSDLHHMHHALSQCIFTRIRFATSLVLVEKLSMILLIKLRFASTLRMMVRFLLPHQMDKVLHQHRVWYTTSRVMLWQERYLKVQLYVLWSLGRSYKFFLVKMVLCTLVNLHTIALTA